MTVSASTSRADYSGNGTTTVFSVPFRFLDNSHLVVYRTVIATGVVTTLALTTDYTVTGAGDASGGSITTAVAPASGTRVSILRSIPLDQQVHYVEGDTFPAASHEGALDKLTMLVQQQGEEIDRSVKVGPTSVTSPDELIADLYAIEAAAAESAADAAASAVAAASGVVTSDIVITKSGLASIHSSASGGLALHTGAATNLYLGTDSNTNHLVIDPVGSVTKNSPTGLLGYGTGSGGTVTQATSKSTAVTLTKPTGKITMHAAELAAGAVVAFQLTNTLISSKDVVQVCVSGGAASPESYLAWAKVQSSSCVIMLKNMTTGALSEAVEINFVVLKGATS